MASDEETLKEAGAHCFKCARGEKTTFESRLVDAINNKPSKKSHWAHLIGTVNGIEGRVFSSCQAKDVWNEATK